MFSFLVFLSKRVFIIFEVFNFLFSEAENCKLKKKSSWFFSIERKWKTYDHPVAGKEKGKQEITSLKSSFHSTFLSQLIFIIFDYENMRKKTRMKSLISSFTVTAP